MEKPIAEIKNGKYFLNGEETTDPKMIEIIELMVNPPVYVKDFRPRSHQKMAQDFVVRPFDTFTVIQHRGLISDSISLRVTNTETKEDFRMGMANRIEAWKLLKKIHEMGNREVNIQVDDDATIPYHLSAPYECRFGRKAA